ncbi:hypothetical protein J1605_016360 [Eschrichtius robustus]|uniref:Carcinoembryonic antigen-related cell adhesion molecule 1 n=1 Tax=Eschrichtius robustus TaxID=9764 RepID=A0AB34G9L1_ESCRO|nr:hypothetical protein J1605_016360 [Eschrichtius robustus]
MQDLHDFDPYHTPLISSPPYKIFSDSQRVIYGPDPPMVNPPDPEDRHLVIPEVSLGQEGRYTCEASNSITHLCSSASGKIRISEAPENDLQPALLRTAIPGGGIAGITLGVLIGVALTGTAGYFFGVLRSQSLEQVPLVLMKCVLND